MKGIELTDDFYQSLTNQFGKKTEAKPVTESKKDEKPAEKLKESEETEQHVCPLCESQLKEPIADEKLQEHIDWILGVINENFEVDGDSLDEETEEDEEETTESEDEESDDTSK